MRSISLLLLIFTVFHGLKAQQQPELNAFPAAVFVDIAYAVQLPEGHMKQDFNFNSNIGTRIGYITPKNWVFAAAGEWIFSDDVKTDVLAPLREANGNIIDIAGRMGLTQLGERGFMLSGQVGRIFLLSKNSRRHSIETRFGVGYLQHWFRIRLLGPPEELPQLNGDYLKGYDRRTAGFALQQYVGYKYMSPNRLINLFIGFDFTEGFTKNRRNWNFDTREADTSQHYDFLLGMRAGFTIPFFIYSENTRINDLDFY